MSLTKVSYSMIEAAPVNVRDFGAVGDGVADDTFALQSALDAVFSNNGGTLRIPAGTYKITADLVPQINGTTSRFFRIIGDGMDSTVINGGAAGYGLKIYADTPPSRTKVFVSLLLQNFSMKATGLAGIGFDIYSMQRSVLSGVSARGYNYGVRIRSSWNNSINNRCQFQENNVGIKVPAIGSGSSLNEGFNNIDISGVACSLNNKAGISIAAGNVISIRDTLLESCPVGIYLMQALKWVYINNLYYEATAGASPPYRLDRDGNPTTYLIYCGSDETFAVGDATYPVKNLVINNAMEWYGGGRIWLDNVYNANIPNGAMDESNLVTVTDRVKFARAHGIQGDNRFATLLQNGQTASTANGVFKSYPYNMVSNGNFAYPNLPPIRNFTGTATTSRTTQSVNGTTSTVMAVTLPVGETTNRFGFIAYLGNEFGTNGAELSAAIRCKSSASTVSSVAVELRNNSGTTLVGTQASKSSGVTNWFSLNASGNPTQFGATVSVIFVVTVTRSSAAAADTLYIDEVVLAPRESDGLLTIGPQDADCGLTGVAVPIIAGGSWFYQTIDPGLQQSTSFRVVATPRFDSTFTATEVQIQYLTGPDDGKFNVWCSRTGVTIDYHIFRLQHLMP